MRQTFAAAITIAAAVAIALPVAAEARQSRHSAESTTSATSDQLTVPNHQVWLGTVRLPVAVEADGKTLRPGRYRIRLTGEHATQQAIGQSNQLERWVEFVQGSTVKGRALAPVVPSAEARQVANGPLPHPGTVRLQRLRGNDYYRLWFNYRGDQVLIYLPLADRNS